ncbi:NYN domain-containing protein [Sphaerospermopsis sp. LEGE 08334]|uniref:NYN domain-containing protein n=1 Tax=Sphaerospermopsis sp. LEGE 08334 TaxID=1828651 RepID=UPI00187F5A53|nr:NYN domain-containing protein [Sphaerospermopsis sp. LEGE 08334]MBE9055350.1 NYN domain-containing protein [Sphaerospermopsis sp. LEGE 08334]
MSRFNTAILYDIENLTKGYSFSRDFIKELSLKQIYRQILDLDMVERISLQRAYANWSDPRLSLLKGEINELGIDPIQIFGFARYHKKNAADIQLAVDAMDITISRPHIEVYVIVSGDGGFASLAKKLHEYGKQVIGCAYENAANDILKSVCDHFIRLEAPEEDPFEDTTTESKNTAFINDKGLGIGITHPFVVRMANKIEPIYQVDKNSILFHSQTIINWFCQDSEARKQMNRSGIPLSTIREAFKYAIPGFKPEMVGFSRFAELLQFVCTNTESCVGNLPPSNTLLVFRNSIPSGVNVLPDILNENLHTPERYQNLLASGKPRITIEDKYSLERVVNSLISRRERLMNISEILDILSQELPDIESNKLNNLCLSLVHCNILKGEPEAENISEQKFKIRDDFQDVSQVLDHIKETSLNKILPILGDEFRSSIFDEIIPW